jgi:hypothetical protein
MLVPEVRGGADQGATSTGFVPPLALAARRVGCGTTASAIGRPSA